MYTISTMRAGPIVIQKKYPSYHKSDTPQRRRWKQETRSALQIRTKNMKTAGFKLRMYVAHNFTAADTFATFTCSDKWLPKDYKEAVKMMARYLRRLGRFMQQRCGKKLKWIYVIEHKHGAGRYHFHMISNVPLRYAAEAIALWDYGTSNNQAFRPVRLETDERPDALYMVKEAADRPEDARLWHKSRNVTYPPETREQVEDSYSLDANLPAGARKLPGCECFALPVQGMSYEVLIYSLPDNFT